MHGVRRGYDRWVTAPPTIRIPRWIQLVGLPVLLLLGFFVAEALGHVIFLFLTGAVIAFTLNPLVRDLTRLRLPRGVAVAVVSVVFATISKDTPREQVTLGAKMFATFIGAAILFGWVLRIFPL